MKRLKANSTEQESNHGGIKMEKQDLKQVRDWVRVEKNGGVHKFHTFNEALASKIGGNLMTQEYYDFHYSVKEN
jgi:hypothetical protein